MKIRLNADRNDKTNKHIFARMPGKLRLSIHNPKSVSIPISACHIKLSLLPPPAPARPGKHYFVSDVGRRCSVRSKRRPAKKKEKRKKPRHCRSTWCPTTVKFYYARPPTTKNGSFLLLNRPNIISTQPPNARERRATQTCTHIHTFITWRRRREHTVTAPEDERAGGNIFRVHNVLSYFCRKTAHT